MISYQRTDNIGADEVNSRRFISEFVPLFVIVLISVAVLPLSSVSINNNSGKYLLQAAEMMQGRDGPLLFPEFKTTRGPVFPMLLVMSFKLAGKKVQSASLITRVFFSLGIIIVYLLGRVCYGKGVGVLASLLVLTSSGINQIAESIDTDIVLPFFIILFILFYYLAIDRLSRVWAVFAGVSLGMAFMVKESALLCAGVCLAMLIFAPRIRRRDHARMFIWIVGAVVVTLTPWAIRIAVTQGSLFPMLGVANPDLLQFSSEKLGYDSTFSYLLHLFTMGLPKAFYRFYSNYLKSVTFLSPLMVVGFFFLLFRSIFLRRLNDLVLVFSVMCFVPLVLRVADTGVRSGQMTMVYMILYVFMAVLIFSVAAYLTDTGGNRFMKPAILHRMIRNDPGRTRNRIFILLAVLMVSGQLFASPDRTFQRWTRDTHRLAMFTKEPFEVYNRFTTEQEQAAEWLKLNAPEGAGIMADGYTQEALDFFMTADKKTPVFHPTEEVSIAKDSIEKRIDGARPLYFITYSRFTSGSQLYRLVWPIFEDQIIEALSRTKVDYLVISGRGLFFESYFNAAPWASLKFAKRSVRIYGIDLERFTPVQLESIGVNDTINDHLIWLEEHYPDEYLLLKEKLGILGLSVDDLTSSRLRYPEGQIY